MKQNMKSVWFLLLTLTVSLVSCQFKKAGEEAPQPEAAVEGAAPSEEAPAAPTTETENQ